MVDPVAPGPVNSASAGGVVAVRRQTTPDSVSSTREPAAKSLPRLLDLVADLTRAGPPIDYVKIAQVRRAIADGSYRIDADALAKAITGFSAKA